MYNVIKSQLWLNSKRKGSKKLIIIFFIAVIIASLIICGNSTYNYKVRYDTKAIEKENLEKLLDYSEKLSAELEKYLNSSTSFIKKQEKTNLEKAIFVNNQNIDILKYCLENEIDYTKETIVLANLFPYNLDILQSGNDNDKSYPLPDYSPKSFVNTLLYNNEISYKVLGTMSWTYSTFSLNNGVTVIVTMVAIYAAIMSASLLGNEFTSNTIKMLFIRPFSKTKILTIRFLSIFIQAIILMFLSLLTLFFIHILMHGYDLTYITSSFTGQPIKTAPFFTILGWVVNGAVTLLFYCSLSVFLVVLFKSRIVSVLVAILFSLGNYYISMLLTFVKPLYFLFFVPHINLNSIAIGEIFLNNHTYLISLIVMIVYIVLLNLLSIFILNKRDAA